MLTGKFRASYAHVFEPQESLGGGEAKYSITMILPKTDVASINLIYAEIEKAKQEGVQKAFGGKMPPTLTIPIYDGDGFRPNGELFGAECRGCMIMKASSRTKPSVVDINLQQIINLDEFYSGCYARATITFFAYNQNGNKGIGCGLNNVQKLADGDPLSGRTSAKEDFGGTNAYQAGGTGQAVNYMQGNQAYQTSIANTTVQSKRPPYQQGYGQQATYQQGYEQQSAVCINPITGLPMPQGGVMGI